MRGYSTVSTSAQYLCHRTAEQRNLILREVCQARLVLRNGRIASEGESKCCRPVGSGCQRTSRFRDRIMAKGDLTPDEIVTEPASVHDISVRRGLIGKWMQWPGRGVTLRNIHLPNDTRRQSSQSAAFVKARSSGDKPAGLPHIQRGLPRFCAAERRSAFCQGPHDQGRGASASVRAQD